MTRRYRNHVLATVHRTTESLFETGVIDVGERRQFDVICLELAPGMTAAELHALRLREQVSLSVLARFCNVPAHRLAEHENGKRKINGALLRLLLLVRDKGLNALT